MFLSLEGEATLPAWYSSLKFAGLALLFALIVRRPAFDMRSAIGAGGVLLFLAMSADEVVGIHERLQLIVASNLPDNWIRFAEARNLYLEGIIVTVPAAIVVSICIAFGVRYVRWRGNSGRFILGFAVLLAGAVVFDLWEEKQGFGPVMEIYTTLLEEALEFFGLSLMLLATWRAFGARDIARSSDGAGIGTSFAAHKTSI